MAAQNKLVGHTSQIRRSKGRLVIAIDSGTTRCQVAFAAVTHTNEMFPIPDFGPKEPQIRDFVDWPGFNEQGDPCPSTTLYYPNLSKLPITGHELRGLFRNPKPEATDVTRIFRLWKLLFHSPDDPTIHDIQERLQHLMDLHQKTARGLMRDWVALMYQELLTEGYGRPSKLKYMFDLRNLDIEIVVPVPPGRTAIAHDEVLNAFIQGPITADQVSLVSEPEALFRAWVHDEETHDWKLGDRYCVLDAGGGTGCIVRYRLIHVEPGAPPRFEQEFGSESIICGSETISDQFEKLANSKVAEDEPNRSWVLDQMRREFDERTKYTFGSSQERWSYLANRPGSPTIVDEYSYEEIARCFDQCVDKLIAGIERQLAQGEMVDYLVLGGGLCTNDYVLMAIENKFGAKLNIRRVSSLKCHVAKGAVLTRLYDKFVSRRPVKLSQGVVTLWIVNDEIEISDYYDQLEIEEEEDTGLRHFWAVQWLAKKGQLVDARHELSSEAGYVGARERTFPLTATGYTFHDKIISVDYSPGDVEFTPMRKDGTLMDHFGRSLPGPIRVETLGWNAEHMGVHIAGLQMELKDVSTRYWIKAWSLQNKRAKTAVSIVSSPMISESLIDRQKISQNLLKSFELGSGIAKTQVREMVDSKRHHLARGQERPSNMSHSFSSPRFEQRPSAMAINTGHFTPMDPPSSHVERWGSLSDRDRNGLVSNPSKASEVRMRQSTDSSVEYAEGAPRNNGGCWTCLFRKTSCGKEPEACRECLELGLLCEYGCPRWWYDEDLREAQKRINAGLIYRQKASLRKRKRSGGQTTSAFSPINRALIRHRANAESRGFLPKDRVPDRPRLSYAEMSYGSPLKVNSEDPQQHEDLYEASPVPLARDSQGSAAPFAPSDEPDTGFNHNGGKTQRENLSREDQDRHLRSVTVRSI